MINLKKDKDFKVQVEFHILVGTLSFNIKNIILASVVAHFYLYNHGVRYVFCAEQSFA